MRAIQVHESGEPEVLRLGEAPVPRPGPGQVLLRVAAAGLNFYETLQRRGRYRAAPSFPYIPGGEAAGVVEALGPGVAGPAVGTRVMALTGPTQASYAEYALAPADTTWAVPGGMPLVEAAALPLQGLTALGCLRLSVRLQSGETTLIHAAAGGVGSLALQLAKALGAAQVIGTAGGAEKCALARELGADLAIDYRAGDFAPQVKEATGGRGVDTILDAVGGATFPGDLACLAPFGRIAVYGAASGRPAELQANALSVGCQSVAGYMLGTALQHPEFGRQGPAELLRLYESGRLKLQIGGTFPLAEAAEAQRRLEQRESTGKLVLIVDEGLAS